MMVSMSLTCLINSSDGFKVLRVVIYELLIDFPNLSLAGLGLPETMRRLEAHTWLLSQTWGPVGKDFTSVAQALVWERRLWHRSREALTSDQASCGS